MIRENIAICFVANFHKTIFFNELAKRLMKNNISVFWIVTKSEQYQFLKENYPTENILYINRSHIKKTNAAIDDFKINELVYGDRVFKHEIEAGIKFLENIQVPIYDFMKSNTIKFIIGEITWAHELLLHRMAKKRTELNCIYLECSLVRIPNKRFAFFTDETQYDMMEFNEPHSTGEVIKVEKPTYLKINDTIVSKNKSIAGRLNRLKRFATGENIEKNDPNVVVNNLRRLRIAAQEEFNKSSYQYIKRVSFDEIKQQKYIFVGFHKQPEASIDVSGRYYEDQFLNIVNLWRLLPQNWKIAVKEHTNAIGDRTYKFYRKLQNYPGVVIVDEKTDSKLLVENSALVASVTGTIAYEAALLKKPAITFSKVFFNRINYCKHITIDDLVKYKSIEDLVNELISKNDNRIEFTNYLLKNTFDGYITDPVTDQTVLDEDNLEKICKAIYKLIEIHG